MSNAGQAALGIVGGIVGFYLGGPTGAAYGFQLGLAVGTVVSPTQLPGTFGPRLTDNRTTSASIGAPVVEVFGCDAVAGTVIWIGDVVEHANTSEVGGKGAPEQEQTTYSYTQSIAVGLARGPMGGIQRIWENGKLVYDLRPQQPDESDIDYYQRGLASTQYGLTFTLYLGDELQLPDPTIEAKEGLGNVPAYRELMYVVYPDRQLTDEQARRHPNFKFEIFDVGSQLCTPVRLYAQETLYDWLNERMDPCNPLNEHSYFINFVNSANSTGSIDSGPYDTLEDAMAEIADFKNGRSYAFLMGHGVPPGYVNSSLDGDIAFGHTELDAVELYLNQYQLVNIQMAPGCFSVPIGFSYAGGHWGNGAADIIKRTETAGCGADPNFDGCFGGCDPANSFFYTEDAIVVATRSPARPDGYTRDDSNSYHVLRKFVGSTTGTVYPLGPMRLVGDIFDTQEFWEEAYAQAVANFAIEEGLVYGVDYPETQTYGFYIDTEICEVDPQGKSIADIVEPICNRCGLYDVDVGDLRTRYVRGYQIPRVMDGRSAIAPLRQIGFFDAVESGRLVKFPTRGKAVVKTLTTEDLGAHAFDSEQPPAVTTTQQQDVELPRQLFVQYRDPARDYEIGEQASPTRLITDAINDVYVDVAAAIDATTAKQCAEVLWADMWASRWRHSIALDYAHTELEATDAFLIPVDGRLERVRAISIESSAVILRQFQLVRDDDGSYVSDAIADPPENPPPGMVIYAQTTLVMLDLPPLREADNDAGFYVAAIRTDTGNRWGGATITRSTDGTSFAPLLSVTNEAIVGSLVSPLAFADHTIWDDGNELIIDIPRGQFANRPEDEVLAGANTLAIGVHGRWEIVQFVNAVQIGLYRWRLTRLLRGRRGTDWAMGSSLSGDSAVLISGDGIARASLAVSEIGKSFTYKAITINTSLGTGVDQSFTGTGEALRPFAPVHIEAVRDVDGNIAMEWIRRDRLLIDYEPGEATPMSEIAEDYEIDVLDGDGNPRRTISVSTPSAGYSEDQQITDFGSLQDLIWVRVYQISVAVGRGHYGEAFL